MTLRPEIVRERLRKLRDTLGKLEPLRAVPRGEFAASHVHYWLAERGLQLAAEAVFDIGNHVLAGHFGVYPPDYRSVIEKLAERGVVSAALRERLRGLAGFRNILVHDYMDIDEGRVFEHLQKGIPDLRAFADEAERFLDGLGT